MISGTGYEDGQYPFVLYTHKFKNNNDTPYFLFLFDLNRKLNDLIVVRSKSPYFIVGVKS